MLVFIFGIIFGIFCLPVIDSLTSLAISAIELAKSWFAIRISKNNHLIQNPSIDNVRPIGFKAEEVDQENDL